MSYVDTTTNQRGSLAMDPASASGPSYLQNQYIYAGNDSMVFSTQAPNVFIHSGNGNDAIQVASGRNVLDGGLGIDRLNGDAGNDLLIAGRGADIVNGGAGVDMLHVATTANVAVDLAVTGVQRFATGSVTVTGVENLRGGSGNDVISGGSRYQDDALETYSRDLDTVRGWLAR